MQDVINCDYYDLRILSILFSTKCLISNASFLYSNVSTLSGIYISAAYLTSTPKSLNSFGSISENSLSRSEHSESKNSMLCVFFTSAPLAIKMLLKISQQLADNENI